MIHSVIPQQIPFLNLTPSHTYALGESLDDDVDDHQPEGPPAEDDEAEDDAEMEETEIEEDDPVVDPDEIKHSAAEDCYTSSLSLEHAICKYTSQPVFLMVGPLKDATKASDSGTKEEGGITKELMWKSTFQIPYLITFFSKVQTFDFHQSKPLRP